MTTATVLDLDALRAFTAAGSDRAKRSGAEVAKRRSVAKLSQQRLADLAGTSLQTIFRIERGELVPRDYLRQSIAYVLMAEVEDFWTPPTRQELFDAGLVNEDDEAVAS